MTAPAAEEQPSALWQYLSARPREDRRVPFPYSDGGKARTHIRIRPLTANEQMICASAADAFAKKATKGSSAGALGFDRVFADAMMLEVIYRACRSDDDPTSPAFPLPNTLASTLSATELSALFAQVLTVSDELGPFAHNTPDEEFEALITTIAAEGSAYPFDLLPRRLQHELMLYAACQLRPAAPAADSRYTP